MGAAPAAPPEPGAAAPAYTLEQMVATSPATVPAAALADEALQPADGGAIEVPRTLLVEPVSYTHLTLPTILLV